MHAKICIGMTAVMGTSSCSFQRLTLRFPLSSYRILFTVDKASEGNGGNAEWIALKLLRKFETQYLI